MYRLPAPSNASPKGKERVADVAGPPSPHGSVLKQPGPPPATVEMMPAGVTLRTAPLKVSAMKRAPAPSSATSSGNDGAASVAGPPSPHRVPHPAPLPATVQIENVLVGNAFAAGADAATTIAVAAATLINLMTHLRVRIRPCDSIVGPGRA